MINYSLKSLIKNRRGTVRLPIIEDKLTTRKQMQAALYQMVRGIFKAWQTRTTTFTIDADQEEFDALRGTAESLGNVASSMVKRIIEVDGDRHTDEFNAKAKEAFSVDLKAVVRRADIEETLNRAIQRNTSLIKSLGADTVKRIEQAVLDNEQNGRSKAELERVLRDELGVTEARARLIARDQTAKLNSQMTEIRQRQAGIEEYDWHTSADERVRPLHQTLQGSRYKWGERTGAEEGKPPGEPIQCRCVAEGVIDFTFGAAPKPAALRTKSVAELDLEGKAFVLNAGRKDGKEHLYAFDSVMRLPLAKYSSGKASSVGITPALSRALADKNSNIVVHHNHPRSSSLSAQDLMMLSYSPGLRKLFAHGHNGSTYSAVRSKAVGAVDAMASYQAAQAALQVTLSREILNSDMSVDDVQPVFNHLINLVLHRKRLFKYDAQLAGPMQSAFLKFKDVFNRAVKEAAK